MALPLTSLAVSCCEGAWPTPCPGSPTYAAATGDRLCREHAIGRVRRDGLGALDPADRAAFLGDNAGYASGASALDTD